MADGSSGASSAELGIPPEDLGVQADKETRVGALAQPDAATRREMVLAHVALTLDNNKTLRVVSPYGDQDGRW